MKISFNWLKQYIGLPQNAEETAKMLTNTGLEVEGIEQYETIPGGLRGLVTGEVLTCEKHPNADKLKVTTVDIGNGNASPIVCGAPNVEAGQKVIVATVGSTLHPVKGKPFKIKKAKIRGEVSEGMICAEDEIGLSSNHDGIITLRTDLPNGTPASRYYDLESDAIFEIGLTPNRADAASHIGTARDLKAVIGTPVEWPSVKNFATDNHDLPVAVAVKNHEACPRYSGVTISGITVKESPRWLKNRLLSIGLSPINNVVDVTNYVLHETGQPLHAFDADKIAGHKVIVQTANEGNKFVTLDEKERTLKGSDLMICNGEGEGMCIAGVFGGLTSGVTAGTTRIFLESAYFAPAYIRSTAQYHQLKTDASFRYERGTDPEITVYALKRAALLIKEIAGGSISSEIVDIYPEPIKPFKVEVSYRNIDRLIGHKIDKERIHTILSLLDIELSEVTDKGFSARVPAYRVDVQREADIIEEILRIYGFNNIPLLPTMGTGFLAEFPPIDRNKLQTKVATLLTSRGYYEIMTNSMTKPAYSRQDPSIDDKEDILILNRLSEDLGVMRRSLLYSMMEVAAHNINRKQTDLKLFEFGKVYRRSSGAYQENRRLAIALSGSHEGEHWNVASRKVAFHDLSAVVNLIIAAFTDKKIRSVTHHHNTPFEYALELILDGETLATLGKADRLTAEKCGLKQELFYADIDCDLLFGQAGSNIVFSEVSRFPEVRRDLSLVLDKRVTFDDILSLALQKEQKLLKSVNVFDVYEGENIDKDKKAYALSFTLQDLKKTLTDKVIDNTMNKLIVDFENELGAIIRK